MTLSELVPFLDLCQQLKAAGLPQGTALVWADNLQYAPDVRATESPVLMTSENAETIKEMCKRQIELGTEQFVVRCAAPTAGELEEWLMRRKVNTQFRLWLGTNSYHVDSRAGDTLVAALAALVLEVAG